MTRAKNSLKSSIPMNLEAKGVAMEDIGRQLIMAGKVGTPSDFASIIDAVTDADLTGAARRCLASPPTVVAYGDISYVPHYTTIASAMADAAKKLPPDGGDAGGHRGEGGRAGGRHLHRGAADSKRQHENAAGELRVLWLHLHRLHRALG